MERIAPASKLYPDLDPAKAEEICAIYFDGEEPAPTPIETSPESIDF